jgi:hypothetical protein
VLDELSIANPDDVDRATSQVGSPAINPGPGLGGESVASAAQQAADVVELVAGSAAVPEGVALDAAADLIDPVQD